MTCTVKANLCLLAGCAAFSAVFGVRRKVHTSAVAVGSSHTGTCTQNTLFAALALDTTTTTVSAVSLGIYTDTGAIGRLGRRT